MLTLIGEDEGGPVLALCHGERLAGHHDVPRVARLVEIDARVMGGVASTLDPVAAIDDEGQVTFAALGTRIAGCGGGPERRGNARVVRLEIGPRERSVASYGDKQARPPLRELQVGGESADDDRIADVDERVDRRGARLAERDAPRAVVPGRSGVSGTRPDGWAGLVNEMGGDAGIGGIYRHHGRVVPNLVEIVGLNRPTVPLKVEVRVDDVENVPAPRDGHAGREVEAIRGWQRAVAGRVTARRERRRSQKKHTGRTPSSGARL